MATNDKRRQAFAAFLDELAGGQNDRNKWAVFVIGHYADERLEEIRREVVRQVIAGALDPLKLRAWSLELRNDAPA